MMDTKFKEWLLDSEFARLMEAVCAAFMLKESNLDAAMMSNNAELSRLLGVRSNWFGTLIAMATKSLKGQDALDAATDAASEIIQILTTKNEADPLYQGISRLVSLPPEDPTKLTQITALFKQAAYIRVRRFAQRYRRNKMDQMTRSFSTFDKKDADGGGRSIDQIEDGGSDQNDPESQMDSMRRRIMMELEREKQKATRQDTAARWELAKRVAEKRWENPPNFPNIDQLAAMFPEVGRFQINKILGEIQEVATRVAQEMGINIPQPRVKKA